MGEVSMEPKKSETTEEPIDVEKESFLKLMRTRLDASMENEKKERTTGIGDTKFINGEQWTEEEKAQRGKNRLTLTINKLPASLDQIDGDIRLNTPGLKVKAVDDAADPDTADVIEGLVRYIQRNSRAVKIHSYAGLHAAAGGRGAWRVLTEYISDDNFEQDIMIKRIVDAFSVYYDSGAEQDDKQDGMYFFLISPIGKEEYKNKYNHEPIDFDTEGSEYQNWQLGDKVIVAEYFYKDKVGEKTIYQNEDGSVTEEKVKGVKSRKVPIYKVKWAKVDGKRILEEGEIPGSMFPIVLTWGKQLCVDGKIEARGIAKHSKDACKLYNYSRSNDAESTALQPKQPYLMPDICMTDPFRDVWDKANDENLPYLPYRVDKNHPNIKPTREAPAMASSANREQIMIADAEIRDTVGIQKAALGKESNETSGVAIRQRKQESDTGQFAYIDNLGDAIVTEGKIILSMIPEIFDTEKQLRILGKDMQEKVVTVNDNGGIDLTTGRYDVDINVEGSYSTQREEFQDKIGLLLPVLPPEHVAAISDLLFEMQDFHRADDIAARLKKLIPPELLESEDEMDEDSDLVEEGNGVQTEGGVVQPGFEEPPIDPALQAQMEMANVELETAQIKRDQEQAKLNGLKLDNDSKKTIMKEDIVALINEIMQGRKAE